jgi:hypothetical protein
VKKKHILPVILIRKAFMMAKQRAAASPLNSKNSTVARRYLSKREVEPLIKAAKTNHRGHRDATMKREADEVWTTAMIEAGRDLLLLERASASRPFGEWNDDDFYMLAEGECRGSRGRVDVDFSLRVSQGSNANSYCWDPRGRCEPLPRAACGMKKPSSHGRFVLLRKNLSLATCS